MVYNLWFRHSPISRHKTMVGPLRRPEELRIDITVSK
jgi:hypothetical protein